MFTTKEAIRDTTGIEITPTVLMTAQMMIEAYIGRSDGDVTDSSDREALRAAVTFQAVYIRANANDILEQAAIKTVNQNEMTATFNEDMFAPFMSPWAIMACKNLSWKGSRSLSTGPFHHNSVFVRWERD